MYLELGDAIRTEESHPQDARQPVRTPVRTKVLRQDSTLAGAGLDAPHGVLHRLKDIDVRGDRLPALRLKPTA